MLSAYGLSEETLRIDPIQEVLVRHREEIADIVQASGLRPDHASTLLEDPIELYAGYVSRLPATRDAYYNAPEGLLRLGLDCALLTARKAQAWEFSGLGDIERRRIETPRWRVACILAALLGDLHHAVSHFAVWGGNERWSPLAEPLSRFGERQADRRVRLERRGANPAVPEDRSWNLPLAARIIDDSILDFLNEGDVQIVADFFAVLSGEAAHRPSNAIWPLVADARDKLVARDRPPPSGQDATADVRPRVQTSGKASEDKGSQASGSEDSLDYRTQLFVREVRRLLTKPRSCKGRVCLHPDGRLAVWRDWIAGLGFSAPQLETRFLAAGWSDARTEADASGDDALFFNERGSNLLLGNLDRGGLLSTLEHAVNDHLTR